MSTVLTTILGAALKSAWSHAWQARVNSKRQILLEELSAAKIGMLEVITKDELLSCIYQFDVAAMKGAAGYKLKLLARVLRGQIDGGTLIAEEFLSNAEMISSLRAQEIKLIATLYRFEQSHPDITDGQLRMSKVMIATCAALVPKVFETLDILNSVAVASQRTGLIIFSNFMAPGAVPDNLFQLSTTTRMGEFAALARFNTLGIEV